MAAKGFMTISQLAGHLGVTTRTVERWWAAGKLPEPVYEGATKVWSGEQVQEIIRNRGRNIPKGQVRK